MSVTIGRSLIPAHVRPPLVQRSLQRLILPWEQPVSAGLLAALVYLVVAARHGDIWEPSQYAYFNYLADAFLEGQLFLTQRPLSYHDLSIFQGRYYLYWPPFPALLLMPFVAIYGVDVSDILFTIGIGGVNVALVAVLLRAATKHGLVALDAARRSWLVLTFAFGSVHMALAPYGRVWYTAQLVGFLMVGLAYLAVIELRGRSAFVVAGVTLSAALLTRNHLALAGLWPAIYLLVRHRNAGWRWLVSACVAGLLPLAIAVTLLGLYNALRFGDPLDNGIAYHHMSGMFRDQYQRWGAFDLHYLGTNLRYQYLSYPFPLTFQSLMGASLFLLSPPFFAIAWAFYGKHQHWSALALFATMVLVAIPILLLMGTGWRQFGPRYTLDFTVPLLLLTAMGVQRWPTWLLGVLTTIAIGHYVVGSLFMSQYV